MIQIGDEDYFKNESKVSDDEAVPQESVIEVARYTK